MVNFQLDEATTRRLDALTDFLDADVAPLQAGIARTRHEGDIIGPDGRLRADLWAQASDLRLKSAKAGFYAMHLPEDVGGGGVNAVGMLEATRLVFSRGLGFTFAVLASIEGPSRMLANLRGDQRRRYLDPLVRGEKTTCFALTEPSAGSDARAIQTTAEQDGDAFVLNGRKAFITNGAYADFAQVFAKTAPDEISLFLVDKGAPGFEVGEIQETIANNGLPCELAFNDCRVPAVNMVGARGDGFWLALQNINDVRVQIGGMCLGLAEFAIARTVAYVTERKAFGKPVSKYQGVSFPLADSATELAAAHALALRTAWKIDEGEDAIRETSMTKLYATEMLWRVADRCLQAHGGAGTLRETEIERILRWARVMRVFEGTSEIQRHTIAKTMGL